VKGKILDNKDKDCLFTCYMPTYLHKLKQCNCFTNNDYNSLSESNFSYKGNRRSYCYYNYKNKNNKCLSNNFKAIFEGIKQLKPDKVKYFDSFSKYL
jgi:alpha-L-fucosidase